MDMCALPHLEDSTLQLSQLLARWVMQLTCMMVTCHLDLVTWVANRLHWIH